MEIGTEESKKKCKKLVQLTHKSSFLGFKRGITKRNFHKFLLLHLFCMFKIQSIKKQVSSHKPGIKRHLAKY